MLTGEKYPLFDTDGSSISNVKRVPVGRKFTSIDVFEKVSCIPLATARLFRRGSSRDGEEGFGVGSFCGFAV